VARRPCLGQQVFHPEREGGRDGICEAPPLLDDVLVAERRDDAGHVTLDRIDVQLHGWQYDIKLMAVKCALSSGQCQRWPSLARGRMRRAETRTNGVPGFDYACA